MRPNKVMVVQDEISYPVRVDVLVTLHQFIQLQTHQACNRSSGGGNGGDDLSSNELTLRSRHRGYC